MNKKEAIKAMLDGEKVSRIKKKDTEYLYFSGECIINERRMHVSIVNMSNDDGWEIYKEPIKLEVPEYMGRFVKFKGEDRWTTILDVDSDGKYMLFECDGYYTEEMLKDCFHISGEDF